MNDQETKKITHEVPTQVCQKFLDELNKMDMPEGVGDRLQKVLLDDKDFSEKAIKAALFPNDQEK